MSAKTDDERKGIGDGEGDGGNASETLGFQFYSKLEEVSLPMES